MARIYVTSLNKEIKREIADAKYSLEEIKFIKENVSEMLHRKNKAFRLVVILFGVLAIALLGITIIKGAPIVPVLLTILCLVITVGLSWFLSIGNFKCQYNHAVKKGYPEYVDELCL